MIRKEFIIEAARKIELEEHEIQKEEMINIVINLYGGGKMLLR